MTLTLHLIDPDDYTVHDDGQPIGRIRYARERVPGVWLWHITVLSWLGIGRCQVARRAQGEIQDRVEGIRDESRGSNRSCFIVKLLSFALRKLCDGGRRS